MEPTIGRIVHYKVGASNYPPNLVQQNGVKEGDVLPAVIVRVWSPTCVNLKVLCDGVHDAWLTSVTLGEGPYQWSWPPMKAIGPLQTGTQG